MLVLIKLLLVIGAGLGFVFTVIYVNTIEYWLDIKKYGRETADEIRRRW